MEPSIDHSHACGHGAAKPTQALSDEHRIIERVLGVVEKMTHRPVVGVMEKWKKALDFIRHFADECHHFKEEQVLFPAMEEHCIPREGGPIGMMLMEHEEGRGYVRAMCAALGAIENQDAAAEQVLFTNARSYLRLLREHIQKEDEILFPMADSVIPGDRQRDLQQRFAEHEAKEMGAGTHERYVKIADELTRALS